MRVWIRVTDAPLERTHGFLRGDRLGSNDVGDLEIEGNILTVHVSNPRSMHLGLCYLQATPSSFLDLLVQGRVGRRGPPVHHVDAGVAQEADSRQEGFGWVVRTKEMEISRLGDNRDTECWSRMKKQG